MTWRSIYERRMPRQQSPTADGIRGSLSALEAQLAEATLTSSKRKLLESHLQGLMDDLGRLLDQLDPISQPASVFDPANPKIVGRFVSLALVAQKRHPLAEIPKTYGSGVYAIYYKGDFPLYAPLSGSETPIYVGQAAPASNHARTPREQGNKLSARLDTHRKNVAKATSSLRLDHFEFRSLVVQTGWETAAEDYLIHLFRPIWNSETNILYGIGKHGDDAVTRANKRSPWDTLHPGRAWAARSIVDAKTIPQIEAELRTYFGEQRIFRTLDEVLTSFIEELRQV
jgi:Eco29kI restriction endonuclease